MAAIHTALHARAAASTSLTENEVTVAFLQYQSNEKTIRNHVALMQTVVDDENRWEVRGRVLEWGTVPSVDNCSQYNKNSVLQTEYRPLFPKILTTILKSLK